MRLHLNLTTKLLLVFVLFAALTLLGAGVLFYTTGRESLQRSTTAALLATALEKQAALHAWTEEQRRRITNLANNEELRDALLDWHASKSRADEQLSSLLRLQSELHSPFLGLLLLDPQTGRVIATTDQGDVGASEHDRPYFINGRRNPFFQSPYYSEQLRAPATAVAAPVRLTNGEVLGVLVARLTLDEMSQIINRRSGINQSDEAYLVNSDGVYASQPRLLAEQVLLRRRVNTEAVQRCLQRNSGVLLAPDYRDIPAIIVYRWLSSEQMCLVVKIDQSEAFESVASFGQTIFLIGVFVLLVAVALGFWLARNITRPVLALQAGVARFGRGELDIRLPEHSHNELGLLAREFNMMAAALAEQKQELQRHTAELEQRVEERTRALKVFATRLEQSNRELQDFASVASHDLQEPLRKIQAFGDRLKTKHAASLNDEGLDYLSRMQQAAQRMQVLIDDLLTFSRVTSKAQPFAPVDLAYVAQEVKSDLDARIERTGGRVEIGALPTIEAEPTQMRQLLQNLIANALKFHRPGEAPIVKVSADLQEEGADSCCRMIVEDNGIGFDEKYLDRIFTVFQRLHGRSEYEGTGIGLAVCRRIVERHGGSITARSAPGQGSTFIVTLPLRQQRGGDIS